MSRFFFYFWVGILLFASVGFDVAGQTNNDANLEREIKDNSKGYLYGEAVGDTQEDALSSARNMLRPSIETDDLKKAVINWKDVAATIVDSAQYLVKPRGNKTRAIVYLQQKDLPGLIEKYSKQGVKIEKSEPAIVPAGNRASDQEKEEMIRKIKEHPEDYIFDDGIGSTQGKAEKSAQEKLGRPIMRIIADYPAISMDKDMVESIAYDTECIALRQGNVFYVLAYIRLSSFHCNLKRGVISGRSKCEDEVIVENTPKPDAAPARPTEIAPAGTNGPVVVDLQETAVAEPEKNNAPPALLQNIMNTKTINELRDVFIANKNRGKLVYGQISTMSSPESSYLVVYNDVGEILTFYGAGTSTRKNLLTGALEQYKEVYPEGRVMWFQIFE